MDFSKLEFGGDGVHRINDTTHCFIYLYLNVKTLLPIIYPFFYDQPVLGKGGVQMREMDLNSR